MMSAISGLKLLIFSFLLSNTPSVLIHIFFLFLLFIFYENFLLRAGKSNLTEYIFGMYNLFVISHISAGLSLKILLYH
jgi:hypothetical protein